MQPIGKKPNARVARRLGASSFCETAAGRGSGEQEQEKRRKLTKIGANRRRKKNELSEQANPVERFVTRSWLVSQKKEKERKNNNPPAPACYGPQAVEIENLSPVPLSLETSFLSVASLLVCCSAV